MLKSILATKLYIPVSRSKVVARYRLTDQLNEGLHGKLILICAPAGYGKTTLVTEWLADLSVPAAWLSLDAQDSEPTKFLTYLIAALQTIAPNVGTLSALLGGLPFPPMESILTPLISELDFVRHDFVLVLDDYHLIDSHEIDGVIEFLLRHMPPQMHVLITTRTELRLPLAKLRARNQAIELRTNDLRFNTAESEGFLNEVMRLDLPKEHVVALANRTEGWIAGLQLAAISMDGHRDRTMFIESFTGSHHAVLDYFVDEVLRTQPESVQTFLLRTSVLDRLCAPLCDFILEDAGGSAKSTLQYIERANLFLVPLDDHRHWYRYHHLFAQLLRTRLDSSTDRSAEETNPLVADIHVRASQWYEDNAMDLEAFKHAVAAKDIDRAERLMLGNGMPLHFRGAIGPVLGWLESLPAREMDTRPTLWVMYASALSMSGRLTVVETKLRSAEQALQHFDSNETTRNLNGHIAAIRALLAANNRDAKTVIGQSNRALEYLHPDNLPVRTATTWKLGWAHQLQGDNAAAIRAYSEAIADSRSSGNRIIEISALVGLAQVYESENQLELALQLYLHVLDLLGEPQPPAACEVYLGLTRIHVERNDLDIADHYAQRAVQLASQLQDTDRWVACLSLLARLKHSCGEIHSAESIESKASNTTSRIPEPLTNRELEILRLIAIGLSNKEISERLFLALSTVKGHNMNIFGKLQVRRRTEAIVRARELGLI